MTLGLRTRSAPIRPAVLGGLLVAVVALGAWGVWLAGGEGNALKALVAVWLAALPVLGIGALAGRLVAGAVLVIGRRPGVAGSTAPQESMDAAEGSDDAMSTEEQDGRADRT